MKVINSECYIFFICFQEAESIKLEKEKVKIQAEELEKIALEEYKKIREQQEEELREEERKTTEQEAFAIFTMLDSNQDKKQVFIM